MPTASRPLAHRGRFQTNRTPAGQFVLRRPAPRPRDGELLTAGRQPPGAYRVVVHSWRGTPNQVELAITFVNSAGEVGAGA